MNPKLISRHIEPITGTGRGPSPAGCHRRTQAARAGGARATSRQIANLLDGGAMTPLSLGDQSYTDRAIDAVLSAVREGVVGLSPQKSGMTRPTNRETAGTP